MEGNESSTSIPAILEVSFEVGSSHVIGASIGSRFSSAFGDSGASGRARISDASWGCMALEFCPSSSIAAGDELPIASSSLSFPNKGSSPEVPLNARDSGGLLSIACSPSPGSPSQACADSSADSSSPLASPAWLASSSLEFPPSPLESSSFSSSAAVACLASSITCPGLLFVVQTQ